MDQGLSTGTHQESGGLRERNLRTDSTVGREALTAVGEVEIKDKDGKASKTFGRTPDGTGKLAVYMFATEFRIYRHLLKPPFVFS